MNPKLSIQDLGPHFRIIAIKYIAEMWTTKYCGTTIVKISKAPRVPSASERRMIEGKKNTYLHSSAPNALCWKKNENPAPPFIG
jgi:hypothetical protein